MTEFFRFRSIDQVLGKYQELERQTIYFASPEELNDPMEGFRNLVWNGDKIVWTNLFKHYVHSLFWTFGLVQVAGNTDELGANDILVEKRWNEPPNPQAKILFEKIWDGVFSKCELSKFSEKLANTKHKVRHNELMYYIWHIHFTFLLEIKRNVEKEIFPKSMSQPIENLSPQLGNKIYELINQIRDEKEIEAIYIDVYQQIIKMHFKHKYNPCTNSTGKLEKNIRLLLFDFPQIYLKRLESLLWPPWYTACFMKNYQNSSAWGHYGDGHKGVCLIFESEESDTSDSLALDRNPENFHEIRYAKKTVEIDFFRSIGMLPKDTLMKLWYSDQDGNLSKSGAHIQTDKDIDLWLKKYWDDFNPSIITKTKDWSYEQEYRLILGDIGEIEKTERTLKYEFDSLKGIIFGIKTSNEDKSKIIKIIEKKCQEEKRKEFLFFQAYYSHESGDIRKFKIYESSPPAEPVA